LWTAAVKGGVHKTGVMDAQRYAFLDAGRFWVKIWNTQWYGDQNGEKAGEWPGGSGVNYLYTGNHWFGTLIDGKIYVSGDFPYGAGGTEWKPQPPTENELLESTKSNWSSRPDKVKTLGDKDTYAIAKDDGAKENGSIPTQLEVHGICWGAPGHDDWVVLECWLTNLRSNTIKDCYMALAHDLDIGGSLDYIDDLVGYDGNDNTDIYTNPTLPGQLWKDGADGIPDENDAVNFASSKASKPFVKGQGDVGFKRMMPYMFDDGGEGRNVPGYCGVRVMGWLDDAKPEETLIELSSQHSWDIMNDPDSDAYKYGYMIDTGTFEEITTAYDWRICPAWGPFELEPNGVLHWYTGIIMGDSLNSLRKNADQCFADFLGPDGLPNTSDDWKVVAPPASPRLIAVRGDNQVILRWNPRYAPGKNLETEKDPRNDLVDFDGYIVWRSNIGLDSGWEPILWVDRLTTNPNKYFPWGWRSGERIPTWDPNLKKDPQEPDLTKAPAVEFERVDGEFPAPTRQGPEVRLRKVGGYYELVDGVDGNGAVNGVLDNGTRYYYSVVAYDFGSNDPSFTVLPTMGGRNANALAVIPLPTSRNVLDDIRVVPNPYKGSADWEEWTGSGARLGRIYFMNLPPKCTIRIYTVAGDLVRTLEHNDVQYGAEPWDLTGNAGVQVASGIYIYHVYSPDYGEKVGKFAVLIGQN